MNFLQQLSIAYPVFTFCVVITDSFIAVAVFFDAVSCLTGVTVHPRVLKLSDLCLNLESFGESKA